MNLWRHVFNVPILRFSRSRHVENVPSQPFRDSLSWRGFAWIVTLLALPKFTQGIAARQTAQSFPQGGVESAPGFLRRLHDRAGVGGGPFPRALLIRFRPRPDLLHVEQCLFAFGTVTAMGFQQLGQRRVAGQAAMSLGQRAVDALPGITGRSGDGSGAGAGPATCSRLISIRPGEDLLESQRRPCWSFLHGCTWA
jgi:hypothetical protein